GMPVGAYAGKKEIMKKVSPLGGVYQGGTLSGNPVSMKLGLNTITYLKEHPETYDALEKKAQMLEEEWTNSARRKGVPIAVNRVRGMMSVFMTDGKVKESKDVDRCEEKRYEHLFKGMLKEGILFPPSQYEGLFLSDAHTMEDVEKTIRAFEKVVL
ncbi:MAG TPA: aspartate aminotransferase family protein, partial [Eubacteriaceae bacterium]|nr:aspartate aminotransferase family protein [Eubacteriaceae bacterium]